MTRDSLPPYTPWICDIQPALSHVARYQVLNAVYGHISRWVTQGTLPPTAPRVDVLSEGPPVVLNRTSLGLATGGIQLSQQAVPTAVENGINSGPDLCILYGSHTPLDAATLAQLGFAKLDESTRDRKADVLRAIVPMKAAQLSDVAVRGQYGQGNVDGRRVPSATGSRWRAILCWL